jgi:organic radical activating enzyme
MEPVQTLVQYPVMESFYTIQGEGIQTGRAAWFIRLGGCDVGCVWCDVKESWEASRHSLKSVEEIVSEAAHQPARYAVITGGEPAMYDLKPLTDALHDSGFEIAIETSGAYPLSGNIDWICVSPKKFKAPLAENLQKADELKVVVFHPSDFAWAVKQANECKEDCALLLQPEYGKFNEIMPLIVRFVQENPRWRISLQTHKIIGIP